MFNSVGSKVALVALSEVNHGGQVTSTGIGKKIKEIELENFRNLARRWRDLKGEDNTEIGGERVIWAWIEADRWESALKKCEFRLRRIEFVCVRFRELKRPCLAACYCI